MARLFLNVSKVLRETKIEIDNVLSQWSTLSMLLAIVSLYYLFLLSDVCPCPSRSKGAILTLQPPGIWRMSGDSGNQRDAKLCERAGNVG
jgi:hypothetical protein